MTEVSVTYGEWEPIYGKKRKRLVATDVRGLLFRHVEEYTEVEDAPIIGWRRKRFEITRTPPTQIPRWIEDGPTEARVVVMTVPATTEARWEWEKR